MKAGIALAAFCSLLFCAQLSFADSDGVWINKKKSSGVLIGKPGNSVQREGMDYADEFIDIKDAIRLNGTFGLSRHYEKKMKTGVPEPEREKIGEDVLVESLPKGAENIADNNADDDNSRNRDVKKQEKNENKEDNDSAARKKSEKDDIAAVKNKSGEATGKEQEEVKSLLLEDDEKENASARPMKKTREVKDDKAPPIENVEQKEFVDEDDPFLTRKDVSAIPFRFRDKEKPVFFFTLSNKDDLDLWRDLRKNRDARQAIQDGVLEIVVPSGGDTDVMPIMVYNYALQKDRETASRFLDWVAKQPNGWMDVKYADYMNEEKRKERKFEIEADIDEWMRNQGLDTDKLYSDRGTQINIAKNISADTKRYKKIVRRDKHPCVYVNGRERSGYFESIRSLPMYQR